MEVRNIFIVQLILVIISTWTYGFADSILCWSCDSETNPGCGDPWYRTHYMTAVQCKGSCAKIKSKHAVSNKDEEPYQHYIMRTCFSLREDSCEEKINHASPFGPIDMEACFCNDDSCNAAPPSVHPSRSAALLAVALATCWMLAW